MYYSLHQLIDLSPCPSFTAVQEWTCFFHNIYHTIDCIKPLDESNTNHYDNMSDKARRDPESAAEVCIIVQKPLNSTE